MNEYRRTSSTVSLIHYHFVFCPRYRRKIFQNAEVERRFKEIVQEVCLTLQIEMLAVECNRDHAHLFLSVLPKYSPADVMAKIKVNTSKQLRKEFQHLSYGTSLWTRSYFVSTAGSVSSETIQRYIDSQKKRS